jgi:hypothetical protein
MSNSFIVSPTLYLTPALYRSTITLHVPSDSASSLVSISGSEIFHDGTTDKTVTGYIKVGPNMVFPNIWDILDIYPYSNDYAEVEALNITASLNVTSNVYFHRHTENIGYISTLGTLLAGAFTHRGSDVIVTPTHVSTVNGLGQIYISDGSNFVASTINGLGAPMGAYISTPSLVSTVQGLGASPYRYISTASLVSTVLGIGYDPYNFISSAFFQVYTSNVNYCNAPITYASFSSINGLLQDMVRNLGSNGYISTQQLTSTVNGLGQYYISSPSLFSTVSNLQVMTDTYLLSTAQGLGSIGYISQPNVISTTTSIANAYTSNLVSFYTNLGSVYLSTPGLVSTNNGLGMIYVSTNAMTSTLDKIYALKGENLQAYINNVARFYLSTGLPSTVNGLGRIYLSSGGLQSTINGLGSVGYISIGNVQDSMAATLNAQSNLMNQILISTVNGLGSSPFNIISTIGASAALTAEVASIQTSGYTRVASLNVNAYVYSLGTGGVGSTPAFYEDSISQASVSYLPIVSQCNMYAAVFKTSGYGTNYIYGDGSYLTIGSDKRLKENIEQMSSAQALEKVSQLRGVYYKKIGEPRQYMGCIAQELEEQYPEVITTHPSVDPPALKSVKYDFLAAPLVESVKELTKLHSTLKDLLETRK